MNGVPGLPVQGFTNTGESLCIGHLQGLELCLQGRDPGYFPNSFGWKLSVQEDTLCLCMGPMLGARAAFWPGRRDIHPLHSCWGASCD